MPTRYRGATISVAILRNEGNELDRISSLEAGDGKSGASAGAMLGSLKTNEWAVVFTSGYIGLADSEALASALEKMGLKAEVDFINRRSYIALISDSSRKTYQFSAKKGVLHLMVNTASTSAGPIANLKTIRFR